MTLQRVSMPSPCYSPRDAAGVRLLVIHTAEGATTIESLGNYFANAVNEVSSHAGADDKAGVIGVYVKRTDKAWTAAEFNPAACQIELCAFAAWSIDEWHRHPAMLDNVAAWLAEESLAFSIPLVELTPAEAQGNGRGVCQHVDLGPRGGGHTDAGAGFPLAEVLAAARGGAPAPTPAPPPASSGAGAPPWPGRYLTQPPIMQGTDVTTWQRQMSARGWAIAVDGQYGPQSEDVCCAFQAEKALDIDGIVGPDTWSAAWTAPVT